MKVQVARVDSLMSVGKMAEALKMAVSALTQLGYPDPYPKILYFNLIYFKILLFCLLLFWLKVQRKCKGVQTWKDSQMLSLLLGQLLQFLLHQVNTRLFVNKSYTRQTNIFKTDNLAEREKMLETVCLYMRTLTCCGFTYLKNLTKVCVRI